VQLELRDLRLVAAIAAEGSLTQAGLRLHVTQPALSRHLRLLEDRVGAPLFTRTTNRMEPTPVGERLLRHARRVLDDVAGIETELQRFNEVPRRQLRVGTECYTGYHWLPQVINRYTSRHAGLEIEIAFEANRRPMKLLRSGTIDLALLTDGPPRGDAYAVMRLFSDEYIAVVAPSHRLAARSFIEGKDLVAERVLLVSPPASSLVMQRFIKPSGVKLRQVVDVQLVGAIAALAESEFGIGMVPSWTIAPEVRSGRLVPLRLGRNGLKRTWLGAMRKADARESWLVDFVQSIATSVPAMSVQPATSST